MSTWGTLDARFHGTRLHITEPPIGSEGGPEIHPPDDDGWLQIEGRLRDVCDIEHSPAVLAWFTHNLMWSGCDGATLLWEIDGGPRYRYEWRPCGGVCDIEHPPDRGLVKLRGVLD